jgi:polysaccharide biosynthesis/export protein ExoF
MIRLPKGMPLAAAMSLAVFGPASAEAPAPQVTVTGEVSRPGPQPLPEGATVLRAYAKAGGAPAATKGTIAELSGPPEHRPAMARYFALAIRQGALEAAITDSPRVTAPAALKPLSRLPFVAEALRREAELLAADRAMLEREVGFLKQQLDEVGREIDALERQHEAMGRHQALMSIELRDVESLVAKGLATGTRAAEVRRVKADVDADLHRVAALLSRARQNKIEIGARVANARDIWRRERMLARLTLMPELAAAQAEAEAHTGALTQGLMSAAAPQERLSFTVIRGNQRLQASYGTPLQPDDVLEVRRIDGTEKAPGGRSAPGAVIPVSSGPVVPVQDKGLGVDVLQGDQGDGGGSAGAVGVDPD